MNDLQYSYLSNDFLITGAPWVSQAANRRIIQAAKNVIEVDKIENLLCVIL